METTRFSAKIAVGLCGIVLIVSALMCAIAFAQSSKPSPLPTPQNILNAIATLQNSVNNLQSPTTSYYLTKDKTYTGATALSACSEGYHMASLYELLTSGKLQYLQDTALAYHGSPDMGYGPPSGLKGWIRTGNFPNIRHGSGVANCSVWSSENSSDEGSTIGFQPSWLFVNDIFGPLPIINIPYQQQSQVAPWFIPDTDFCNQQNYVWCIQDP